MRILIGNGIQCRCIMSKLIFNSLLGALLTLVSNTSFSNYAYTVPTQGFFCTDESRWLPSFVYSEFPYAKLMLFLSKAR